MLQKKLYKQISDISLNSIVVAKAIPSDSPADAPRDFKILYVNGAYEQLTGDSAEATIGTAFSASRFSASSIRWCEFAAKALKTGRGAEGSGYSKLLNRYLKYRIFLLTEDTFCIVVEDETERRFAEQKLEKIAFYDDQTGLRNRAWLMLHMDGLLRDAHNAGSHMGFAFIRHDNIEKIINMYGYGAGDELLSQSARRLRRFPKDKTLFCRFSDADFICIVKNISGVDEMANIADAILEILREPYKLSTGVSSASVNIGVSMYPADGAQCDDLLKFAYIALNDSRKKAKNFVSFFGQVMQEKVIVRAVLEHKFSAALEDKKFKLFYQPQYSSANGSLRGFEALMRWDDETLGSISPDVFIPLAEETGEILELGKWALHTACSAYLGWRDSFGFDGVLSVNVSPVQIRYDGFLADLLDILRELNFPKEKLELEITEGVFIDDLDNAVRRLSEIKALGIGIALDDFGTGYSSFSYLHHLPLTALKIDKSFIFNIHPDVSSSSADEDIVDAIVNLSNKFGISTIAEGVETTFQLDFLTKINCQVIQGFLTGKPMPLEQCNKLVWDARGFKADASSAYG